MLLLKLSTSRTFCVKKLFTVLYFVDMLSIGGGKMSNAVEFLYTGEG